jgi:hypothetical protein
MNLSRPCGAILTLLFLAIEANANPNLYTLSYNFPLYVNGVNAYGGGASATLNNGNTNLNIEIFCDDFAHQIWVPYGPPTYPGYLGVDVTALSPSSDLSHTRFGNVKSWTSVNIAGDATDSNTINSANALGRYQMVAYLIQQYHTLDNPTNDPYNNGIQEAIWAIMDPTTTDPNSSILTLPNIGDPTSGLKQAAQWYANANSDKSFLANFQIISDPAMYNCGIGELCTGFQEQLFDPPANPATVPEPRGQLLIILGLLSLCAFRYQKNWNRP